MTLVGRGTVHEATINVLEEPAMTTKRRTRKSTAAPTVFTLPEYLNINVAAETKTALGALLDAKLPVTLDAGKLELVDAAGVQLLAVFVSALQQSGIEWSWKDPSPTLMNGARLLGLSQHLCLAA
jgi:anti-anti-sigma regulatory factor